ncbi:MAG TPA: hypothetical protein VF510_15005 [Ktedonobacterales bacterium]
MRKATRLENTCVRDRRGANNTVTVYVATAYAQALYYTLTGIWPLVDLRSFEFVTGPKVDDWLVKTVGVLVTTNGAVLGRAGYRHTIVPEVPLLAGGSALSLAGIDVVYVTKGRISRIYLLDAVADLGLAAIWTALLSRTLSPNKKPSR